jgi:23S rRNA pseudouridine1911/1915/1917 synthase
MSESYPQVGEVLHFAKDGRADALLHEIFPDISRSLLQKWIVAGGIHLVDQHGEERRTIAIRKNRKLQAGDEMEVMAPIELPASAVEPENIPLDIVYEDEDIIVLNKPRNLVVHPGNGIDKGTLAAGLLYHYRELSGVNGAMRPGIVHRLDKDTPGLMVAARNDETHRKLAAQLEAREIHRIYRCVVWGQPAEESGTIEQPIGRDLQNRLRMKVTSRGRFARTHYRLVQNFAFASLLEMKLDTGRTHQIRVHQQYNRLPIMGDPNYGGGESALSRVEPLYRPQAVYALSLCKAQMLQAVELRFNHPRTGTLMEFKIDLAEDMQSLVDYLQKEAPVPGAN